jgi:hypothetical protein
VVWVVMTAEVVMYVGVGQQVSCFHGGYFFIEESGAKGRWFSFLEMLKCLGTGNFFNVAIYFEILLFSAGKY